MHQVMLIKLEKLEDKMQPGNLRSVCSDKLCLCHSGPHVERMPEHEVMMIDQHVPFVHNCSYTATKLQLIFFQIAKLTLQE